MPTRTESRPVVEVGAGSLEGRLDQGLLHFGGVPYAAPPIGERRWVEPHPVEPWAGRHDCTRSGPAPPQPEAADELVPGMAPVATNEDCLTLEIRTPRLDGRRPVLVWIPGGRFQIGGAALATYDGSRLAAEGDLVVVGVNYRLGALGFLVADGVPPNLGLRDVLAALGWIRAEIVAFGGDPDRIVVMGESAGAGTIAHLLAVPESAELVSGAILQSGAPANLLPRAAAVTVTEALLDAAGVGSVDELRALPVESLVAAQAVADAAMQARVGMMPFHPVVDGELLPRAPLDAARSGELAPVPLVIGTTADEMRLFASSVPSLPDDIAVPFLQRKLTDALGAEPSPEQVRRGLAAVEGDLVEAIADVDLHVPNALLADAHADHRHDVWRYRFDWPAPGVGAAHATDLPFTFGTLGVGEWRRFLGASDPEAAVEADILSRRMRSAWAAFAHDLVPSCDPIGAWPRHDPENRMVVRLGRDDVAAWPDIDGTRFRAWTGDGPS